VTFGHQVWVNPVQVSFLRGNSISVGLPLSKFCPQLLNSSNTSKRLPLEFDDFDEHAVLIFFGCGCVTVDAFPLFVLGLVVDSHNNLILDWWQCYFLLGPPPDCVCR
jgi:hypothetical protein